MIDKVLIDRLLKERNYNAIIDVLNKDYYSMIKDYLIKNNIQLNNNETMLDLLNILESKFPKHKGISKVLKTTLLLEEINDADIIDSLTENYITIKNRLT